jgi:hypothetical protein
MTMIYFLKTIMMSNSISKTNSKELVQDLCKQHKMTNKKRRRKKTLTMRKTWPISIVLNHQIKMKMSCLGMMIKSLKLKAINTKVKL